MSVDFFLFLLGIGILSFETVFWCMRGVDYMGALRTSPVIPHDRKVDIGTNAPFISIIIPGHNEESVIEQCLNSVIKQDYPNLEIIFVNDRSQDRTSELASAILKDNPKCKMLTITNLRDGWTGKCQALHLGVKHSKGDWLAFLDADSTLHPSALSQCMHEALHRRISMITLSPKFVMKGFWEKALQPTFASMSCILFPMGKINDPNSPVASANGMFYLINRDAYTKIGGHEDVRGLAVEDIGIGKRVKASGLGLLFANGREIMTTRMYSGLKQTLCGWTRILSASMNYDLLKALKYLAMHVLMSLPLSILAVLMLMPFARNCFPFCWIIIPLAPLILSTLVTRGYCNNIGAPKICAPLMAIGNIFLIWMFIQIPKKILRKDALQWRGTTYRENRYRPTSLEPNYDPSATVSRW